MLEAMRDSGSFYLQMFADEGAPTDDVKPNDPGDQGDSGEPKGEDEDGKFTPEYVEKLRKENARHRTKAKELEEKLKEMPDKDSIINEVLKGLGIDPDPEKRAEQQIEEARKKAQEAEARANERLIRAEVKAACSELGIVDPDAAFALMDKESVTLKDDGEVEGVTEALEALVKAKPYLVGQKGNVGGPSNPGSPEPDDIDSQIAAAKKRGDMTTVISLRRQKAESKT